MLQEEAPMEKFIALTREVPAIQVPTGADVPLEAGTEVKILHELGGDFAVRTRRGNIFRINGEHADALSIEPPSAETDAAAPAAAPAVVLTEAQLNEEIQRSLQSCFDPEIPVNIVDLGLIYETVTEPLPAPEGAEAAGVPKFAVHVKMTLTAPGCGMGQVLMDDVKRKIESIAQVERTDVELVFSPMWEPSMMTEEARFAVGLW